MGAIMRGRKLWDIDETKVLLKSWKDHVYMYRFLKKNSVKMPLYSAICRDLQKHGFKRSPPEIMNKMHNFRRGSTDFRWYKEVQEIMKMKKIEQNWRPTSELQMEQASELFHTLLAGENVPESVEVVTTNIPNDGKDSGSDLPCHTEIKYMKPEVSNDIQTSLPQLTGSIPKKSTATILLNICREFRNSNRQLEANDTAILELFKEQNDIFRKQTKLMMKLL
ncbi:unnamed protein product [Larinioides sclopetarius]|uniref:Myb/SANT-like DNA-binding domain-containing protein n=1 Tax=Larinioides sclopetarius TaxID=280406 RepID=A0AAV2AYI7_9ARAC